MTDALSREALDNLGRLAAGAPPVGESDPGTRLGKYLLIGEVARGAMGAVYEAEDTELRRTVALKILHDALGGNAVIRLRFEREAQSAAKLSHPNVVRVYDAGVDEGRSYLVMEFVQGRPLSEIIAERRHDVRWLLKLLEKAARGVAAAHEIGIVHRDVKPANILVTDAGEPKVGDFGLAHWLDADSLLTKTGVPLGTPLYMAPEQVRGGTDAITPATDVYGLGCILYEMLAGRPPLSGDSAMQIYTRIVSDDPPPLRLLGTRVPRDLETICMKAIEKDPRRRYADAKEFADDLRRHLEGEPILARPAGAAARALKWFRRHRVAGVAMAVGLAGAVAIAALLHLQAERERRKVAELVTRGRDAAAQWTLDLAQVDRLRKEERRLEREIDPDDGDRKPLWALQKELRALEARADKAYTAILTSYQAALGIDPREPAARRGLAAIYYGEFEKAERIGDEPAMALNRDLALLYDEGDWAAKLEPRGFLSIDSRPSGAEIEICRYRESDDLRLVEMEPRALGPGPIKREPFPAGSYVAVLRKPGFRETRYPVLIERGGAEHVASVRLYTEQQVGPDYLPVPAGPFLMTDERDTDDWRRRHRAETGDYFIARYEVTFEEYVGFLVDLMGRDGVEAAQKRVPRSTDGTPALRMDPRARYVLPPDLQKVPISTISWKDAEAYCAWLTARARERGEKATYRLPGFAEWQKAARGADGRIYAWGNHFDPTFTCGATVVKHGEVKNYPVGLCPKDESPYGVRDLGGSMQEMCADWVDGGRLYKRCAGGSWSAVHPANFRTSQASGMGVDYVSTSVGFRVLKVLDAPEH